MAAYTYPHRPTGCASPGVYPEIGKTRMSSQNPIDSNPRAAGSSTGPRPPQGQPVSRAHTLQSGIHAKSQVIPGEDPAELEALAEGYRLDWAPTSHFECFLVDSLVRADWLLRRLSRVEAETWTHEIQEARKSVFNKLDEDAPLGQIYGRTDDRYTRLQRRMDSAERSYYRALTQLQRLRSGERPAAEPPPDFHQTNPFPGGIRLEPSPAEPGAPAASDRTNSIPPKPAAQAGTDPYPHSARANRPSSGPCRPHQPPAHSRRPAARTGCGSPARAGSISVVPPTVAGGRRIAGSGYAGVRR